MTINVPPAFVLIFGAILVPFLKGRVKSAYLLLLPVVSLINIAGLPTGAHWTWPFLGYDLTLGRIDGLSLPFGYVFSLIAFIGLLFSLHVKDDEHVAALFYGGSAIGAVFAGDLLTLFFFWEIMAFSAAYLIWARRSQPSYQAGMRYMLVHIFGGLVLLSGIVIHAQQTGSVAFNLLGLNGPASYLIFLGFGINAAFPLLHAWLPDAYPEATVTGTVFLSAFTTKTAVYALARSFAGAEMLVWIGAVMVLFPIFYALIENDLRRVLSYSLINKVGFMVVGVGIGTELSLNGAVSHAFSSVLYQALLFMALGAVLHQTGKIKATDLGGLYKTMPWTTLFCLIGAASISAFPLTSGFVSKSMVISAAGGQGLTMVWFILIIASAGVFLHSGIKVPFFAFFSHDSGIKTTDPPLHMLAAMGLTAFLCLFIGIFPGFLYSILPYPVDYHPYSVAHVVDQLQLLLFSALAFTLLILSGVYPAEIRAVNLDIDWLYRKGAKIFMALLNNSLARLGAALNRVVFGVIPSTLICISEDPVSCFKMAAYRLALIFLGAENRTTLEHELKQEKEIYPHGLKKHWTVAPTAVWITVLLFVYLLIYYIS